MFGLQSRDQTLIKNAIGLFDEIERALIFGSRAMGNYKKGSDVDIAIVGEEVTRKTVSELHFLLNEEYPLPYFFDVVHYEGITNKSLIRHIDTEGVEMYRRKTG